MSALIFTISILFIAALILSLLGHSVVSAIASVATVILIVVAILTIKE